MDGIYENNDECKPNKKRKKMIMLDDMIADILSNKRNAANSNIIIYWR